MLTGMRLPGLGRRADDTSSWVARGPRLRSRTRRALRLYTWAIGAAAALGWFVVPVVTGDVPQTPGLVGVLVAFVFIGMLIAVGLQGGRRPGYSRRNSRSSSSSNRRAA